METPPVGRSALIIEAGGERFRFYYDPELPAVLHITWRHGTTPEDAVEAFFDGPAAWNEARARFETVGERHVLYWTRHAHDQSVIVISCFGRWED
ncbi:MAG: hypothetical protein Q8M79_02960 [Dehalococcoidia bacterium]|nr:hypothetical protein [Dehalococcoidia bacterium]